MKKILKISVIVLAFAIFVSLALFSNARNFESQQWLFIPGFGSTSTTTQTKSQEGVFQFSYNCTKDSDCSWTIVNCCSENSGANWNCINEKESIIKCPDLVFCAQYVSPKPTNECKCFDGGCGA